MRRRRRGCARGCQGRRKGCALARRYGRFQLPEVPGARSVKQAKSDDVSWLARTDSVTKEVEFSNAWNALDPDSKRYIALHEAAHLATGTDHNDRFYSHLKVLIKKHRIPWEVAYTLENYNCHQRH